MKKLLSLFCLLLLIFSAAVSAQVNCSMPLNSLKGISLGYSYRPIFILGTGTPKVMYPTHFLFFNLDGDVTVRSGSSSSYYDDNKPFFGGLGLVIGFSAADKSSPLEARDRYYSQYYRITGLNVEKKDILVIGGDLRVMVPFDHSRSSIFDSYLNFSFEAGYMGLEYTGEAGGFNKYVTKKVSSGGTYAAMNLGVKIVIFEVYGGLGALFDLYKKGINFKDPDGEDVKNNPSTTNHFIFHAGAGFVFDLHSMRAFN